MKIKDLNNGLINKEFSCSQLTDFFIKKIKNEDKEISSFITLTEDLARSQAQKIDEKINKGDVLNPLSGIPTAIKDNILIEDIRCTSASKILENYQAVYDATVIEKLKNQEVVILGKLNMDEFAMGSSTENSAFGSTKNPLDKSLVPGGSSGGSAAAVAAGFCSFSLGSDTGGSIRQPAAFCGIVGLKPTYGSVSRYGLMAMASSLDQIGVLAKNVEDTELVFEHISGFDEKDSTSSNFQFKKEKIDYLNITIGIPEEYFIQGIDKNIETETKNAISKIAELGVKIKKISLPHTEYALPVYYILSSSEISANLSKFDGLRYGLNDKEAVNLIDNYFKNRGKGFGKEVKRRILLGTYSLSSGYYDAYYHRAQKVRSLIKQDFDNAFKEVDLIIAPSSPTLPFKLNEKKDDPLSMYLSDIFTIPANLSGIPAMSLPCGEINGFPISIQIMSNYFEENKIFEMGKFFEKIWMKQLI